MPALACLHDVEFAIHGCASGVPHFRVQHLGKTTAIAIETLAILGQLIDFRSTLWARLWGRWHKSLLDEAWKKAQLIGFEDARWTCNPEGYFEQAVVRVQICEGFLSHITFADGYCADLDLAELPACNEMYRPLQDEAVFRQVEISEWGVLSWPNGADLCSGTLRAWCEAGKIISRSDVSAWEHFLEAFGLGPNSEARKPHHLPIL